MRILVLGASGMLGNAMIRILSKSNADWQIYGTIRSEAVKKFFSAEIVDRLVSGVDVEQNESLMQTFIRIRPNIVINCIGLIKQLAEAEDPLKAIQINALLPHRLSKLCELSGARLIHMSTDCVFSGAKGSYCENDPSDAADLYGKSKFLGEVHCAHAITLRTSIIGHELQSAHGLVGWFLSQQARCKGYKRAIFSGLPTVALAQLIRDVIVPKPELSGLYHVAAQPISKFDLLSLIAKVYGKSIEIAPDDTLVIDRSLDATRFQEETGYVAPTWPELIQLMHSYK